MRQFFAILLLTSLLVSCDFFKETDDRVPVARVDGVYLYQEDIEGLIAQGTTTNDSLQIINSFMNRWATQQLLLDGAERNLSEEKQTDFNKLVDQYKKDLYTKAYLEALVKKSMDTSVSIAQAQAVYEANQETFKLNEELVKFRYITIPKNAINEDDIKKRFKRFDSEDKHFLDSISIQFKSYSLNDSIWIKASQITEKIKVLNSENKKELLKKSNFIQLKDSLDLYLMQIEDVLFQNDLAPLEYVKPTIKQIVINKRKLELIKQLEKDITKDAIKNKQFEVYK
mgnify:CR=1 FL=1